MKRCHRFLTCLYPDLILRTIHFQNKFPNIFTIIAKEDVSPYKLKNDVLLIFTATQMYVTQKLVVTNTDIRMSKIIRRLFASNIC